MSNALSILIAASVFCLAGCATQISQVSDYPNTNLTYFEQRAREAIAKMPIEGAIRPTSMLLLAIWAGEFFCFGIYYFIASQAASYHELRHDQQLHSLWNGALYHSMRLGDVHAFSNWWRSRLYALLTIFSPQTGLPKTRQALVLNPTSSER